MKTMTFAGKSSPRLLALLAGLFCLVAPAARADEDQDPPTRVARISYTDGSVSLQPGGEGDWGTAVKNRPMTIGDKIWVDKDSRAELQAGQASIHLGNMTALSFLNLDTNITQMRLPEGSVNFRVRELREGELYEVDTPNLAFTVKQAGAFRIDVNENGDSSRVTVIRGEGQVTTDGKNYDLQAGQQAEFNGAQNPTYSITHAPGPDSLDRWAEQRDLREDNSNSAKYVPRDVPGVDDLDDHGTWRDEPEYGHVWYPNDVPPDWAPYSDGSWNWVAPWGWTWVGYEPWGFAPYHYGRWAFVGGAWGWCPGPFFGPPIYGPAFVGFFGGGWGFGLGFGIGWFPLGFGEPFFPWFHCRHEFLTRINVRNTFIRNVNVLNNRNFNFANAHNVRAVTTASHSAFTNGQRINRAGTHLEANALNGAKVNNSINIKPTAHSSLGAANFNSHVARPSSGIENRSVVARTAPATQASHLPVTMSGRGSSAGNLQAHNNVRSVGTFSNSGANATAKANGRVENSPSSAGTSARQRELSQNRPPSATANSNRSTGSSANNTGAARSGNSRTWEAQGNTTDRGRAPQGFGSDRPSNARSQNAPRASSDRPPWAGQAVGANSGSRSSGPSNNTSRSANSGRSYAPPQRNYSSPSYGRGYSTPRTYSAPSRSYPAPSRSYSAPSHSYSGGGGGSHSSSGGGGSHGGGGGSHGGGGHPHR